MSQVISLERKPGEAQHALVASIAAETATPVDVVKALYAEEIATLGAQAKVKQFIGIFATRRVRQQLHELNSSSQCGPARGTTREHRSNH
jgi:hypothetical protein